MLTDRDATSRQPSIACNLWSPISNPWPCYLLLVVGCGLLPRSLVPSVPVLLVTGRSHSGCDSIRLSRKTRAADRAFSALNPSASAPSRRRRLGAPGPSHLGTGETIFALDELHLGDVHENVPGK